VHASVHWSWRASGPSLLDALGIERATIDDGVRLATEIPGAELVRVEASHWIPQDAPEAFAGGILDFLRRG
jgi:pimeloyl-ACP methyl ester carboxylesterase